MAGHELAIAYQEHIPTIEEKATAAALWAVLIRGAHDGQLDQTLFQPLAGSASLAAIPSRYPSAFRGCAVVPTALRAATGFVDGALSRPLISNPFQCTDDCLISMNEVYALLAEPLVNALKTLGGLSMVYGEALTLTDALKSALADPALAGMGIEQAAAMAISQDDAGALLATIYDTIGQAAAVSAAVLELAGAAEAAPIIAGAASIIGLAVYAKKLSDLAALILACKDWKAKNCTCSGPTCGCADLGESALGVQCCAQGGPESGGGWYVATASPTCCVLNRSEYGKHSEMCYTPPDKAPGRCPSCQTDADCCDRSGAEGNIDHCIGERCCGSDGPEQAGTPTVVDFTCCSGVRYALNSTIRACAPAP